MKKSNFLCYIGSLPQGFVFSQHGAIGTTTLEAPNAKANGYSEQGGNAESHANEDANVLAWARAVCHAVLVLATARKFRLV